MASLQSYSRPLQFFPVLKRVDEEAPLPVDLRDGFRFGVTKEDLESLNISERVRNFLSFRWASKVQC